MRVFNIYTLLFLGLISFSPAAAGQPPSAVPVAMTTAPALSADTYFAQGKAQDEKGNYELAIGYYSLALRQNANHSKALFNRAIDFVELGRLEEAKTDLDQVLALNPTDAEAWQMRGSVHYQLGEYAAAVADFNDALYHAKKPEIYLCRGLAYSGMKYYREAFLDFDAAIDANPNHARAYAAKGDVYLALEQYWEAVLMYDKAIKLEPDQALFYNNRGSALSKLGRFGQAMDNFNQAIQLEPLGQIFINRSFCLLEQGDFKAAKQDGKTALLLSPENPDAYFCIGLSESEAGEYDKAISSFDIAIEINDQVAEYYFHRGKARFLSGDYYKAIEDFYQVLRLSPDDPGAIGMVEESFKAIETQVVPLMEENQRMPQTQEPSGAPTPQNYISPSSQEDIMTERGIKEDPFGGF
ncbi:MAG: tetratricopeptide repeat protein [Bacteroidetes bacterium]|nr:MAG: tetratricopeptide repeat protein [Bacteroidota bacterium]